MNRGNIPAGFFFINVAIIFVLIIPSETEAIEISDYLGEQWYGAVYHGEYATNRMVELLTEWNPDYMDEHLAAVVLANRFHTTGDNLHWEVETQLASGYDSPRHYELNLVLVARWDLFPWDDYLDTSFAFGEGLSYASRVPPDERDQDPNSEFLNYLLTEIAFKIPRTRRWEAFSRIHHRSGVAGTFSGVWGGSNVVAYGLRYEF